jgi:hypothetical protein
MALSGVPRGRGFMTGTANRCRKPRLSSCRQHKLLIYASGCRLSGFEFFPFPSLLSLLLVSLICAKRSHYATKCFIYFYFSFLFEKLCAADNRPAAGRRNLDKGSAQLCLSRSRESFCVPEAGTASRNRRNIGRISYFFYLLCVQNSSFPNMYFCIFTFCSTDSDSKNCLESTPSGSTNSSQRS